MYYEEQNAIDDQWDQFVKPLPPKIERKFHYCIECGKKNYRVKMDLVNNSRERHTLSVYNVDTYKCPRCNHEQKERQRIEGKGKSGHNLGKNEGVL